jgi:xylulokinase
MLVPRPGWAEHRAEEDWWGDFVFVTKALLAQSGIDPAEIKLRRGQRHRPLHAAGRRGRQPLMNGVLYGVDTRATDADRALNARIGERRDP